MIGPVRVPVLKPRTADGHLLRGAALRGYNRVLQRVEARAEPGVLRIGGNPFTPKVSKRLRATALRGALGGFHPAIDTAHFTITPGLIVQHGLDEPVDLSSRVVSFTVRQSINDAMGTARIGLAVGSGFTSLSPFIAVNAFRNADGFPLLEPGVKVLLEVTIDSTIASGFAGPVILFYGRLDRVNAKAGPGIIELQCRDWGAFYQNVTVFPAKYGVSPGGREASLVMGDLLTAHGFDASDLLVLADPDWMVLEYAQQEMGLLDALRAIARQAGRDVRFFSSAGKLVYYTPNRVDTTADLIVLPGRYEDIVALEVGDEDLRNYWDVYYQDAAGVVHGPQHYQDNDSIARYSNGKPRRARINLTLTDNVRDDPTALNFAVAATLDTKDPFVSHGCRMLFDPRVELNDVHYYAPNNVEYDVSLNVAVAECVHEFANGHGMTTVSGRASRIAASRAYRKYPPPKLIASTSGPNDDDGMPEGTVHAQVDSLAFA